MNIVHVVGTGTIGEPLIGLLADNKEHFGIEEVTFHKRTPLLTEKAKVADLEGRGAVLAVDEERFSSFQELGHAPKYEAREAIDRATVVIDCTPVGNGMKSEFYDHADGPRGFMAQGSEFGFGKMYARGINDSALVAGEDRFLHIVSCNTHNIAALVRSLAIDADGTNHLEDGRFLCMRRANDISQDDGFVASPTVESHKDERFGTHHARDAHELFETMGYDLNLYSSAVKINTQYMHSIQFSLQLDEDITVEDAKERLMANTRVAVTHKTSANQVFSFGRDHGYFGRIMSQTVVALSTLAVRNGNEVVGFSFTPQDGNPLLSTVAAMLWYLDPETLDDRIDILRRYLFPRDLMQPKAEAFVEEAIRAVAIHDVAEARIAVAQAYDIDHTLDPLVDAVHLACAEIEEDGLVSIATWNTLADAVGPGHLLVVVETSRE